MSPLEAARPYPWTRPYRRLVDVARGAAEDAAFAKVFGQLLARTRGNLAWAEDMLAAERQPGPPPRPALCRRSSGAQLARAARVAKAERRAAAMRAIIGELRPVHPVLEEAAGRDARALRALADRLPRLIARALEGDYWASLLVATNGLARDVLDKLEEWDQGWMDELGLPELSRRFGLQLRRRPVAAPTAVEAGASDPPLSAPASPVGEPPGEVAWPPRRRGIRWYGGDPSTN